MPPFRLELPDRYSKSEQLFVAKNEYGPKVYMCGWSDPRSALPFDNNPFEENHVNHFKSHHNHLGAVDQAQEFKTTTKDMLEQIKFERNINGNAPRNKMINFFSFTETKKYERKPSHCYKCPSYSTTMQDSYKTPYPYAMKRLAMAKVPHLKYRKMKGETNINDKFLDDGFVYRTQQKICNKSNQFISYNPCTGLKTDGTVPKGDKVRECYVLESSD